MEKSDTINELAAALAKAQAAIQPALKDATNVGFKKPDGKPSKYADLAAVWEACRAPLSANGLSVIQLPADADVGRVALTSMLLHASGQYISSTVSMKLMQDTPHGAGSALTYLRRYALAALVGVVADEDDDGNAGSGLHTNGTSSYAAPVRQPAPIATKPTQSAGRRDLIDRAMTLYGVMKEQGLKYKGKMFKDMDDAELIAAADSMEQQLEAATQAA